MSAALERAAPAAGVPSAPCPPRPRHPRPAACRDGAGLSRGFGGTAVLAGLDLHVPAGQFLAVVGRSGSGKSTLLRLLGGLDAPDAGRIALGGGSARGRAHHVPGAAAAALGQRARQRRGGARPGAGPDGRERARAALARVGLGDRASEWPAGLSGGQKSRVALARALVSRPRMLMLDEPLGALDALTRIEMQDLLLATRRQDGFTAVLVTHDVSEAVRLADRIVVIEGGALTADVAVDLPPEDRRGSAAAAGLERDIVERLLGRRGA